MDNTTCLVTGGAGFIGSHVADELLKQGARVVVLDDLSGGFEANVPARARFARGSILDVKRVDALFAEYRFDYVFHLAAYAAEGLSHFIKRFNYANNLIGSVNLINASVKSGTVRCFIFTSSIAVYGAGRLPVREEDVPRPLDPYGIAKLAVEQDLREAQDVFGLNFLVFRPHNVYGERQNIGDPYRNVIGIFMNQVMQGKPMTIFGDGNQQRAFTYIGDVAPLIVRAAATPSCHNDVFNLGSDTPCTINALAREVAAAFGQEPRLLHLPERKEVQDVYASHEKILKRLGFSARTGLKDGLSRMAAWARATGPRQGRPFDDIEVRKNMPPHWLKNLSAPGPAAP